jgi:hypothetical protein
MNCEVGSGKPIMDMMEVHSLQPGQPISRIMTILILTPRTQYAAIQQLLIAY